MTNPAPSTPPPAAAVTRRSLVIATLLPLAAAAGPLLLMRLAQFGQEPPERLQLPAVLLFGTLFVGVLVDLLGNVAARTRSSALAVGGLLGVMLGLGLAALGHGEARYALAPLAAALGAAALLYLPRRRASMFGAMLVYTACTLLANYTLDSFLPLGDFFLVNVGTLFFGITFTQRDRVHHFGRRAVYSMIFAAAVANVLLAASLGTPLRYVAVSFLSIVVAETADTEIYQRLLRRRWLTRVASSNAISAPLDTLIFTLLAFGGEEFATRAWLTQVIVTDVVVKYVSGILAALGLLALLRGALKPLVGRDT